MKKLPFVAAAISLLLLIGFILWNNSSLTPTDDNGAYKYYWGNTCPHCAVVSDFMNSWQGKDGQNPITSGKLKVIKKEVYDNAGNTNELLSQGAKCGIPKEEIPVPLLVTPENKCIAGDQPIIDHFKNLNI